MATEPQYEAHQYSPEAPEKPRSPMSACLVGCLVAFAVLAVIAVAVGFYVARNWRTWVSSAGSQAIKQGIDASDLPAEEKDEIKAEVDRVATAFREGRLSNEQMGAIMEEFTKSPLFTSIIVAGVEEEYFASSGLSEEEKAQGRTTLKRFLKGSIDGEIDQGAFDKVVQHVAERQPNGEWRLRNEVSDEDLRAFLKAAKTQADEAGIPEQPAEVDPSEEFKRIVDDTLGPAA